MAGFRPPWALCGGWAVDAWRGEQTREHGDVDIVVFAEDQRAIFARLRKWNLVAHELVEDGHEDPWDGRPVRVGTHVHARAREDDLELEVFLDRREDAVWILRDEPWIAKPVSRSIARSPWGLPTAVPEILCFYKATAYDDDATVGQRDHDRADFVALEPILSDEQRDWLWTAITTVAPQHPWLPS